MRRSWVPALVALPVVLVVVLAPALAHADEPASYTDVTILDNVFDPRIVRVPVGSPPEKPGDSSTCGRCGRFGRSIR